MKKTTLRPPGSDFQKTTSKAKHLDASRAKVSGEATEKDLAEKKSGRTMLEAMSELVGCIKSGPSDVSCRHKEYFQPAMLKKSG